MNFASILAFFSWKCNQLKSLEFLEFHFSISQPFHFFSSPLAMPPSSFCQTFYSSFFLHKFCFFFLGIRTRTKTPLINFIFISLTEKTANRLRGEGRTEHKTHLGMIWKWWDERQSHLRFTFESSNFLRSPTMWRNLSPFSVAFFPLKRNQFFKAAAMDQRDSLPMSLYACRNEKKGKKTKRELKKG